MKTRIALLLALAVLLCAGVFAPASADGPADQQAMAQELNALGMFNGKVLDDGTIDFALGDTIDRDVAATMLIRLLGMEKKAAAQAASGQLVCPFTDVPAWAQANVTWLYENNYVNGSNAEGTAYSGTALCDVQAFSAMVLRSLGYSERNGDYTYAGVLDFAVAKGLLTAEQRTRLQGSFTRGDMVELCWTALTMTMRDSGLTLMQKLTQDGAFQGDTTGLSGAAPMTLTLKYKGAGKTSPWSVEWATQCAPVAADLNGDGSTELLYGGQSLICVNGADGEVLWRISQGNDRATEWVAGAGFGGRTDLNLKVQDLDGDGAREIVYVSTNYAKRSSCVAVYDSSGYFKPGWPVYTSGPVYALHLTDLDGDGRSELCLGLGVGASQAPSLYIYEPDGSLRPGWPKVCGYGFYADSVSSADVNGDGRKELVLLYDDQFVCAYDGAGTPVRITSGPYSGLEWNGIPVCESLAYEEKCAAWAREYGGVAYASGDHVLGTTREERNCIVGTYGGIVAEDLDGNGTVELACTGLMVDGSLLMRNGVNTYDGVAQYVTAFILNTDRSRYTNAAKGFDWSQMPTDPGAFVTVDDSRIANPKNIPVAGDVDGDGNKEILYSANDGMVHCWHLDGTQHGAWPFNLDPRSSKVIAYASVPVCADVNGDGRQEVIFTSYVQNDQVARRGSLYVLDGTGCVLAQAELPPIWGADADRADYGPNGSMATPCVADVDGDGRLEIAVTTLFCGVVVYDIT